MENNQKTLKKTKEFRSKKNTKETKIPRKRRTGHGLSVCLSSDLRVLLRRNPGGVQEEALNAIDSRFSGGATGPSIAGPTLRS